MGLGTAGNPWTVRQSGGDYTTLNAALTDAGTAAGEFIEIQGLWTIDDTTTCTVQDNDITITCDFASRTVGYEAASPSNYRLKPTSGHAITMNNTPLLIDGIEIGSESTTISDECIRIDVASSTLTVKNSILYFGSLTDQQDAIYGNDLANITVNLENVISYNIYRGVIDLYAAGSADNHTVTVNSCSFYNVGNSAFTFRYGVFGSDSTGVITFNAFNCVHEAIAAEFMNFDAAATVTATVDNCTTDQNSWDYNGDAPTITNSTTGVSWVTGGAGADERIFVKNLNVGSEDLRLVSGPNNFAQDAHSAGSGAGLTMPARDILRRTRIAPYNMGAHRVTLSEIAFDAATTLIETARKNSFTHTPVGTSKGVLVLISDASATDIITGVTYGGVPLEIVEGTAQVAVNEANTNYAYFLGSDVPIGPQTCAVTAEASTDRTIACITLVAPEDTAIEATDTTKNTSFDASPIDVTIGLNGETCWVAEAGMSGRLGVNNVSPKTDWSVLVENDFGGNVGFIYSYDVVGSTDVNGGFIADTGDDAVVFLVAVKAVSTIASVSDFKGSFLRLPNKFSQPELLIPGRVQIGGSVSKGHATSDSTGVFTLNCIRALTNIMVFIVEQEGTVTLPTVSDDKNNVYEHLYSNTESFTSGSWDEKVHAFMAFNAVGGAVDITVTKTGGAPAAYALELPDNDLEIVEIINKFQAAGDIISNQAPTEHAGLVVAFCGPGEATATTTITWSDRVIEQTAITSSSFWLASLATLQTAAFNNNFIEASASASTVDMRLDFVIFRRKPKAPILLEVPEPEDFTIPAKYSMPELFLPSRKPVGPVEIDETHPLSKGLLECCLFTDPKLENLANSSNLINYPTNANGVVGFNRGGIEIDGRQGTNTMVTSTGFAGLKTVTLVFEHVVDEGTAGERYYADGNSQFVWDEVDRFRIEVLTTSSWARQEWITPRIDGKLYVITWVLNPVGTRPILIGNGVLREDGGQNGTGTMSAFTTSRIWSNDDWNNKVHIIGQYYSLHNYRFTMEQALKYNQDIYQFLKPKGT